MNKLLKSELLQIVRDYNLHVLIPNYHKKRKTELVNEMNKHLVLDESTNKFTRIQHSPIDIVRKEKKKKVEIVKKEEVKAPEGRKLTPEEKERVLKKIADAKKKKEEEEEKKEDVKEDTEESIHDDIDKIQKKQTEIQKKMDKLNDDDDDEYEKLDKIYDKLQSKKLKLIDKINKLEEEREKKEEEENKIKPIDDKAEIISKSKTIEKLLDNIKNNISKDSMKPYLPIIYQTYDEIRDFQIQNIYKHIRKLQKEADDIEYAGEVDFDKNPTLSKKDQNKLDKLNEIIKKYDDIIEKYRETKHNLKDIYQTHKYFVNLYNNNNDDLIKGMGMIHAHLINLSLPQLRDVCKRYNIHNRIKKYSKLSKDDLINEMKKHLSIENNKVIINPQNEKISLKKK